MYKVCVPVPLTGVLLPNGTAIALSNAGNIV
jgi:hypothetical protein